LKFEISKLILDKLEEQVERADHLAALVPPEAAEWRPAANAARLCDLLGHLLECLAGFCATLYALHSDRLAHFITLRDQEVNHCCGAIEARERMAEYMARIREGFALVTDSDLARQIPTVFVEDGEALLTILLGNLEHFINHKHQLFFYLKLLGVSVGTGDLYRLREIRKK
jgi:hypothetical protein